MSSLAWYTKSENLKKVKQCQSVIRKWLFERELGLTCDKLMNLNSHKAFKPPKSQLDYYLENNVSKELIPYVTLQGKTFGEKYMEQLAKEYFNLDNRKSSTHDHMKNNKTI